MRILNKNEFMKLGVCLYMKGVQWAFEGLCLKGDTFYKDNKGINYSYIDLSIINSSGSDELFDLLPRMLDAGISCEINRCQSLDIPTDDDVFLVYEHKDIAHLYCIVKILVGKSNLKMEYFEKEMKELQVRK